MRSLKQARRFLVILWLNFLLTTTYSLKCRSDEGPSDAELKRVARTCMRKVSENSYPSKRGSSGSGNNKNNYYGQQYDQQYGQNTNNKNNYGSDDEEDNMGNNYRANNNNNNNNYDRSNHEMIKHRSRDRSQNNHSSRSQRSPAVLFNFERFTSGFGRYDQMSNGGRNSNGGGGGGNSNGSSNNNNGGSSNRDHRSSASSNNNHANSHHNSYYNNSTHDRDRQSQENACIVHCFFDEMNMLNKDDYPDKHKVNYLLTKDIRDRELRSFYTDTIQECFHYLESQRHRDKCHFSRDLIHCMTEYAKANCDDWNNYNLIFN